MVDHGRGPGAWPVCIVNTHENRRRDRSEPVTTGAGSTCTWFGGWLPASNIRLTYGAVCDREAVAAVKAAVQVTVIDPVWGRDNVLWPALADAVTALDAKTFTVRPGRLVPDPAPYVAGVVGADRPDPAGRVPAEPGRAPDDQAGSYGR